MMLLVKAQRQNVERLNLREVILLLLRTFVVLLLVLAAARPLLRGFWGTSLADHEPTGVVLVFDGTLSMRYASDEKNVFEHSLDRARAVLSHLNEGDRVMLLLSDRITRTIGSGEGMLPHEAERYLEGLESSLYGGTLDDCLVRADALVSDVDQPWKEIYVFTDLQRGFIGEGVAEGVAGDLPFVFFTEKDSGAVNRYLGVVDVTRRDESEEGKLSLNVRAGSSGSGGRPGIFPRLYLDDEMTGILEIQTRPGELRTVSFPLSTLPGAGSRVRVEIEKDGLGEDDVRYFLPGEEKQIEIQRGRGVDTVQLLKVALDLLQTGGETGGEAGGSLRVGEGVAPVLVTFWSDREGVRQAIDRGMGLVLFPEPGGETRMSRTTIPIGSTGQWSGNGYRTILSPVGPDLPACFAGLAGGFPRVKVSNYHRLVPESEWEKTGTGVWRLDLEGGDPFISGGEVKGTRVAVWSVSPEHESTDLFKSPLFIPLLDGLIRYVAGGKEARDYLCGETVTLKTGRTSTGGTVAFMLPGGGEFLVKPDPDGKLHFDQTEEPGFYAASAAGRVITEFTVNVDTAESDMLEISEKSLSGLLAPSPVSVVRRGEGFEDRILMRRGGRELSSWLFLLVFAVLLAESYISGRIKRR